MLRTVNSCLMRVHTRFRYNAVHKKNSTACKHSIKLKTKENNVPPKKQLTGLKRTSQKIHCQRMNFHFGSADVFKHHHSLLPLHTSTLKMKIIVPPIFVPYLKWMYWICSYQLRHPWEKNLPTFAFVAYL